MKITCTQENFKKGINIVGHLTSRNVMLPILNNVLVKATGGVLELVTTNLELAIKTVVRCKVDEDGALTVPGKLLNDYVSLLPSENMDVITKGNNLEIKAKGHSSKVKGISSEDFPLLPVVEQKGVVSVGVGEMKRGIASTVFAVSTDSTRPEISGVLMKLESDSLLLVATDSFRLSEYRIQTQSVQGNFSFIVPMRTMHELSRVLGYYDDGETLQITYDETQVEFRVQETSVLSRLIEGRFPEYRQIIPQEFRSNLGIQTGEFIQAVKLNSLFSRGGVNDIVVDVNGAGMHVSSNNQQVGENMVTVPVEGYLEEYKIVFNYKYLLDGLETFGSGSTVIMKVVNSTSPILFSSNDVPNLIYLVMPIKA